MVVRLLCCGLLFVGSLCWSVHVRAETANPMRAPKALQETRRATSSSPEPGFPAIVFDAYLRFFQQVISPVDGARSTMYPTGSDYARQAFAKHGALRGLVLTVERLMHEGNESQIAPRIRKYGLWRVYDPVAANDWWWHDRDWVYQPRPGDARGQQ